MGGRMRARAIFLTMLKVLAAMLLPSCVRTIGSGNAGVLWKFVGGTQPEVYGEGVHLIAPWNRLTRYDVRTQDKKEALHILSSNGLSVNLEASIRFHAMREELAK